MEHLTLPDEPGVFGVEHPDGFRQRWMPGAFGDRRSLNGVVAFRVKRDDWKINDDETVERTILEAEPLLP